MEMKGDRVTVWVGSPGSLGICKTEGECQTPSQKRAMWNHTASPSKAALLVSSSCLQPLCLSKWNLFLSIPFSLNLSLWHGENRGNYSKCLPWIIVSPLMHSPLGSSYVKRLNPTALTTHGASKETQFSQCSLSLCFWAPSSNVSPDRGPSLP